MGRAWADSIEKPTCARIVTNDFCFFAGDGSTMAARELVQNVFLDTQRNYVIMMPQDEVWRSLIETYFDGKYNKTKLYAMKKEADCFDKVLLQQFVDRMSPEFSIKQLDGHLYQETLKYDFSRGLCANFDSEQDYLARGIGFVAFYGEEAVAGASSYSVYDGGIEIQVGTKPEFRRQGLALACSAQLILACLSRGLYPSWDAQNKASIILAERLGYHFDFEYVAYEVMK